MTNKRQHLRNMHPGANQDNRKDQYEQGTWANPHPNSLLSKATVAGGDELKKLHRHRREYEKDIEERLRWLTEEYGGNQTGDQNFEA